MGPGLLAGASVPLEGEGLLGGNVVVGAEGTNVGVWVVASTGCPVGPGVLAGASVPLEGAGVSGGKVVVGAEGTDVGVWVVSSSGCPPVGAIVGKEVAVVGGAVGSPVGAFAWSTNRTTFSSSGDPKQS